MKLFVSEDLPNHPKLLRLANELKVWPSTATGLLVCLWSWTMRYREDGDLSDLADPELVLAAGCPKYLTRGNSRKFINILVKCRWLDRSEDGSKLQVHDWQEHQGSLIRERAAHRDRMRAARAAHVRSTCGERAGAPIPSLSPPIPSPPTRTEEGGAQEEVIRFLMAQSRQAKILPGAETIRRNLEAALAAGVKGAAIDEAFMNPKNRGLKVWEILDPLRPKERQNGKQQSPGHKGYVITNDFTTGRDDPPGIAHP